MTSDRIPLVDLKAQIAELGTALEDDLRRVISSAGFIGGPEVDAFEAEYADLVGVEHCVGVANGTDAVELALRAVGVTAEHEVVLPANTFIASAEAIARIGARPVLVDVEPDTLLMDPDRVTAALTPRTRVVLPVHLYGQLAKVHELRAAIGGRDVAVVEDAAQSQGAASGGRVSGDLGDIAATSFYPGKNLGAAGDAGAVTTPDATLARRVRLMANHGSPSKYVHDVVGWNSRLDAVQAVVLRHKLRRLTFWNERRRELAERYTRLINEVVPEVRTPSVAEPAAHVWHLYVVQTAERDRVLKHLHDTGVDAAIHYPTPIHLTGAFAFLGYRAGDFPVTEQAAGRLLSLPIHPHLTDTQQDRVVKSLADATSSAR